MINRNFIKKNNLIKVTFYGILFWVMLWFFFPLEIKQKPSFFSMLYVFFNYFFFVFGIKSITSYKTNDSNNYQISNSALKKFLNIIIVIAFLGILLRFLDKFYLRGVSFDDTVLENRNLLLATGPSIISIISAITSPFCLLPIFVYYLLKPKRPFLLLICLVLFFFNSFEFIVLGSRSGLFILLLLFSFYLRYFGLFRITIKKVFVGAVFFLFFTLYSINLFIDRTMEFTGTEEKAITHILTNAGYNFTMKPTDATKKTIINSNNFVFKLTYLGLTNFVQYYLHGLYEFGYMYENYKGKHYYGAYTFGIFAKFINVIFKTSIDINEIQKSPPRTGVYTTFFGPIFIDFGWSSFVFMYFFGVFQKVIYNNTLKGRVQFVPLLFYLLIINFFMPVFNFLNGAQGLYILMVFILFAILYTVFTGKIFLNNKRKKVYIRILK